MDIVKAIISILVGIVVIFVIANLAIPFLGLFALIVLFGVLRTWMMAKRQRDSRNAYEQRARQQRAQGQRTNNSYRSTSQGRTNSNPNVIDAEFTEEEIVD